MFVNSEGKSCQAANFIFHLQVQTAQIPITTQQVREGWQEIQQMEALQRQMLELEAQRELSLRLQKQPNQEPQVKGVSDASSPTAPTSALSKQDSAARSGAKKGSTSQKGKAQKKQGTGSPTSARATSSPPPAESSQIPVPDPDDDEPDRL